MQPFVFQNLTFFGGGDIGKPEKPVACLTPDAAQRICDIVGTASDKIRGSSIS